MRPLISSAALLDFLQHKIRHAASRLRRSSVSDVFKVDPDDNEESNWRDCLPSKLCEQSFNSSVELFKGGIISASTAFNSTDNPQTTNQNPLDGMKDVYSIVVSIMVLACVISMVFNLTIVWSVRWIRRALSPTLYLSLSLALADAYSSMVLGLGLVVNSLLPNVIGIDMGLYIKCYILVLEAFRLGGVVVTVLHLLALAVNHYIGILRPLHYAATVTRRTTAATIAAMWLIPMVFFLAYFCSVPEDGFQTKYCSTSFLLHKPFRLTTSLLFFIPLVLMFFMYVHMFIVVRQHQENMQQLPSTRQFNKNVKAIITTLLILGTYVLGWMPAVMYFILTCLDCLIPYTEIQMKVRLPVGIFINSMIVLKSFVDPIIYVVRMPEIKNALKTIWRTRCGILLDGSTDTIQMHSRTDLHRMTFVMNSRKIKGQTNSQNSTHTSKN